MRTERRKNSSFLTLIGIMIVVILMVGLLWAVPFIRSEMEVLLAMLTVAFIVLTFAIIRRNVKEYCNNKINNLK